MPEFDFGIIPALFLLAIAMLTAAVCILLLEELDDA